MPHSVWSQSSIGWLAMQMGGCGLGPLCPLSWQGRIGPCLHLPKSLPKKHVPFWSRLWHGPRLSAIRTDGWWPVCGRPWATCHRDGRQPAGAHPKTAPTEQSILSQQVKWFSVMLPRVLSFSTLDPGKPHALALWRTLTGSIRLSCVCPNWERRRVPLIWYEICAW